MAAERPPLTPDERAALHDLDVRRRLAGGGRFRLAQRSIASQELAGIDFDGIDLEDVDFVQTRLSASRFTGARLRGVGFAWCDLDDLTFESCAIEGLALTECHLARMRLVGCFVRGWVSDGCVFAGGQWRDVRVEGLDDHNGLYDEVAWSDVELSRVRWRQTQLKQPKLARVAIVGGSVTGVQLVESDATDLTWRDLDVDGLELVLGTYHGLTFAALKGGGLRIAETISRDVDLHACHELTGITLTGGDTRGLSIRECPSLSLLALGYAEIHGLLLLDSRVYGGTLRSVVLGTENLARGCWLEGLTFEDCDVHGLTMVGCGIGTVLRVANSHFRGLRLSDVHVQAPTVESEGAVYEDGDRFPG